MERKRIKIACVVLGILGLIAAIITCALPSWKVSSFTGHYIVTEQVHHEGLWMSCVYQSTGLYQCKTYDSLLILGSDLQAARPMTIMCCIMSTISLLLVTCIKNEITKLKSFLPAGVGMILAGLLLIIPVSWTAKNITRDFNNLLESTVMRREIGLCISIGWAGGVLLLLGGGLLCRFSRPRFKGTGDTTKYHIDNTTKYHSDNTTKYHSDNTTTLVIYANDDVLV